MRILKSNIKSILRFLLGLIIFFVILSLFYDIKNYRSLIRINWHWLWLIVFLTLIINLLAVGRWHLLLRSCTNKSNFTLLLRIFMIGRFIGQSSSQIIGDIGSRIVYLKKQHISIVKGAHTILIDKFFEAVFFIAVLAIFFCEILIQATFIKVFFVLVPCLIVTLAVLWFLPELLKSGTKLFPKKLRHYTAEINILHTKRIILIFLTIGKYTVSAIRYMAIMKICGINLTFIKVFVGTSLAQVGLITGITPGGLGLVEAGWAGVLNYYGVVSFAVAKFLLVQRLLIFISVFILAFTFYIIEMLHKNTRLDDRNLPILTVL